MNGPNWIRPVILAASCLILGFVGGWTLASLGGDTVDLPDASVDVTVTDTTPATDATGTTADPTDTTGTAATDGTDTQASTGTGTDAAAPAPPRDTVAVAVLNGSGVNGKAAETATQLTGLGYANVQTGNAERRTGSVAYFRPDAKPAADQLASDLQITEVAPIEGSPVASSAPATAQVVVVLGG